MTHPASTCPNCGAKITFRWSSSVQTVCEYCKSILIRTDLDLKKVGIVADLPVDSSPIQMGSEGIYAKGAFVVAGRIIYEYELGTWNEWHIIFNNGTSQWLSDAQNEYVVTMAVEGRKLPAEKEVKVNQHYVWDNVPYTVSTITKAHFRGVEGELPFQCWDKEDAIFVDLRSETGDFATLDYGDEQPALYCGKAVEFEDLHMKNLRSFEGWG
jgi:hypothetical protein